MTRAIDEILTYWYGDAQADTAASLHPTVWFQGGEHVDREILERFGSLIEEAGLGRLESWKATPRGRIAWTILLDQFTRNAYRDSARMYVFDTIALQSTREAIALGQHREMPLVHRMFLYLPLEHSEELHAQEECVALYEELAVDARGSEIEAMVANMVDFAHRHERVVRRFGRYPHRNELLSRRSTEEELAFLDSPEAPF